MAVADGFDLTTGIGRFTARIMLSLADRDRPQARRQLLEIATAP